MSTSRSSQSRTTRNVSERERRSLMKNLYSTLLNLLPPHRSKLSIPELVEYASACVTQQQQRIEELKQRKVQLQGEASTASSFRTRIRPVINITDSDSIIQIELMAGIDMKYAICDIITILEEERVQVLSANYRNVGDDKFLLSVHSQMAVYPSRIGIENNRVHERLKTLHSSWENSLG